MTLRFVSSDRMLAMRKEFDRRYERATQRREHLWVATVCYFVTPPFKEGQLLGVENMAMDPALGCYICEQVYTPTIGNRCAGEPR